MKTTQLPSTARTPYLRGAVLSEFPPALLAELGQIYRRVNIETAAALWLVYKNDKEGGIGSTEIAERVGIAEPTARYYCKVLATGGCGKASAFVDRGMGLIEISPLVTRPRPYRLTQKGRLLFNRVLKEV